MLSLEHLSRLTSQLSNSLALQHKLCAAEDVSYRGANTRLVFGGLYSRPWTLAFLLRWNRAQWVVEVEGSVDTLSLVHSILPVALTTEVLRGHSNPVAHIAALLRLPEKVQQKICLCAKALKTSLSGDTALIVHQDSLETRTPLD